MATKRTYRLVAILLFVLGLGLSKALFYWSKICAPPMLPNSELVMKIEEWEKNKQTSKIYPFNPNFISDYRGYFLNLTPSQIDRLHIYREQGKWINSPADFKKVTGVSDQWLDRYSTYFLFPKTYFNNKPRSRSNKPIKIDLNTVDSTSLKQIRGIGPVLSRRIINYRTALGGFSTIDQVREVYGLSPEVSTRLIAVSTLASPAQINRLDLQSATVEELTQIPYLNYYQARAIVAYRTANEMITLEQISLLPELSSVSIERLALYLF